MSTDSVNAPPGQLLTQDERQDIKGKIRSLNKLRKRTGKDQTKKSAIHLLNLIINSIMAVSSLPFTQERRTMLEIAMKIMRDIEDVVIRVVVVGETAGEAFAKHIEDWHQYC